MKEKTPQNNRGTILIASLIIAAAIIISAFLPRWEDVISGPHDPIAQINSALTDSFRSSFPALKLHSVGVSHFERPEVEDTIQAGIRIRWDSHTSTSTGMVFYPLGDSLYVGSFFPGDDLKKRGISHPINVSVRIK